MSCPGCSRGGAAVRCPYCGHFNHPHAQHCATCRSVLRGPGTGIGDMIASATKAIGIQPCAGCERRRRALNRFRIPWGK